ncbi:uncharacterized protein LOC120123037 [Hibiscus syriacus]|uniref:uncharacterized protein LOC120123037 n=1 Tax=Hibiscus syriacus TaxID=106335 RepID=UPI001922EDD7|nr:uncharacterized protein LOC120123037 [Hibiscus syriacus]
MQEDFRPVTGVTQAMKEERKVERKHKRFRSTEEDKDSEEEGPRRSWRDTILNSSIFPRNVNISMEVETEDSYEEEEYEGDDIPTIKIPQELKEKLMKPWRKAIIIKILGKTVAYKTLINRVINLWKLEGEFECIDLGYGLYAIKFQNMVDRAKVLMEGPWKILDHYITVQRWRPNFVVASASIPSTAVWIHIPGLPIEYFEENVLCSIGNLVGKPLKIDCHTAWSTRGRFARICVEIDLNAPLLSKLRIGNKVYNIEYEGLHSICFKCGVVGHRATECLVNQKESHTKKEPNSEPHNQEQQQKQEDVKNSKFHQKEKDETKDRYGPWMLVQRR